MELGGTRGNLYRQDHQSFVASRYLFCVSQTTKTWYARCTPDAHYSVASCMFVAAIDLKTVIDSNHHRTRAILGTSTFNMLVDITEPKGCYTKTIVALHAGIAHRHKSVIKPMIMALKHTICLRANHILTHTHIKFKYIYKHKWMNKRMQARTPTHTSTNLPCYFCAAYELQSAKEDKG